MWNYLSVALLLDSLAGLALGLIVMPLFIWRTKLEDNTLQKRLPGYKEYAQRVRYRLVPMVF